MATNRQNEAADTTVTRTHNGRKQLIEGAGFVLIGLSLLLTGWLRIESGAAIAITGGGLLTLHGAGRMHGRYVTLIRDPGATFHEDRTQWAMIVVFLLGATAMFLVSLPWF